MTDYNLVNITMKTGFFICMSKPTNYKKIEIKLYQYLIKKLMYLFCSTKSNIIFAIGQLSKHNFNLRAGYINVAQKVVRYSKRIIYLGLVYKSQS